MLKKDGKKVGKRKMKPPFYLSPSLSSPFSSIKGKKRKRKRTGALFSFPFFLRKKKKKGQNLAKIVIKRKGKGKGPLLHCSSLRHSPTHAAGDGEEKKMKRKRGGDGERKKEMKRRGYGREGGELFDKVKGYYERRPRNSPLFFRFMAIKVVFG